MATTTSYRWIVNQGQDESLVITFTDSSGGVVDLSSATAEMQIRTAYSASSASTTIYSVAKAASTTVTFNSRPTEDETITLVSTDGTSKTYVAKDTGTSGNLDGSNVIFDTGTDQTGTAASFATAVNHSNGHASTITAVASGTSVTLTQDAANLSGNTTPTIVQAGTAITAPAFTGGFDSEITLTSGGVVTVNLTDINSAALTAPSNFVYDIELTGYPSAGKKYRLLEGTINTRPEVTK